MDKCWLTLVSQPPSRIAVDRAVFNESAALITHLMASVDQLVPVIRLSDDSDNAVANIRSLSLEGSWRVPLCLVRMEVHDIVRLALTVCNPATPPTPEYSISALAHQRMMMSSSQSLLRSPRSASP